jgi:hypothetical protein
MTEKEFFNTLLEGPERIERSIRGRINIFKAVGAKYLKVTYKEFSEEILVISVVDKA